MSLMAGAKSKQSKQPDRARKDLQKTDWGEVAGWYDQLVGESGSEYHREVVLPGVLGRQQPQHA